MDYYGVLGVKKGATPEEIKKAYKELAKKFHPDVSKEADAEKKFKEINEAYSILSDPEKKTNYDNYGDSYKGFSGYKQQGFGQGTDFDFEDLFNQFGFSGFSGFSDLNDMFGGGRGRGQKKDLGSNIKIELVLSFNEAAFGETKEINYDRIERCTKCQGSGAEGEMKTCPTCHGKGYEVRQQRTPFGVFQSQGVCHTCAGHGQIAEKECTECDGKGFITKRTKLSVKIPAGINTGNHLRVQEKGHEGKHGAGDLFLVILVEPHEIFKRDDDDIYAEIPISFTEAALGATVEVPTLDGKADLKIPSGTQTGTIFKMKGKGIQRLNKEGHGDEYVKVIVETPKSLSKKQKELLDELEKETQTAKKRKGIFEKILGKF
ncbi:MAG: molecular chaperone DnaJ [archaeon]|jgi:molecular chaperone DnaJ